MSSAMIATKKREKKSSNETKESVTKKRCWATRTIIAYPIITTMHRTNPVSSARKRMSVQRYALFPLSRGGRCFSILYLALGLQFGLIGYRWIRFEDERRRIEKHLPPLDRGNKAYLWTDILFRALLTGFVLCIVVMIGEAIIVLVAQNLFFVTLSFVSLLDFFSLFFVAIIALLIYIGREAMDRFLDLKPLMED